MHGITPTQIKKSTKQSVLRTEISNTDTEQTKPSAHIAYIEPEAGAFAADPIIERMTKPQLEKSIANTTKLMKEAAKRLDFIQAAQYRDELIRLQKELEQK